MTKIIGYSTLVLIWLSIAFLFYVNWLTYGPVEKLEIKNEQPIKLENNILHPGEKMTYTLEYCKYHNYFTTIHRTLLDGQKISLIDTTGGLPLGCHSVKASTGIVPETINPGQYHMIVDVEQHVNFLRTVDTVYETEVFTVVPRGKNDPWREIGSSTDLQVIE